MTMNAIRFKDRASSVEAWRVRPIIKPKAKIAKTGKIELDRT